MTTALQLIQLFVDKNVCTDIAREVITIAANEGFTPQEDLPEGFMDIYHQCLVDDGRHHEFFGFTRKFGEVKLDAEEFENIRSGCETKR